VRRLFIAGVVMASLAGCRGGNQDWLPLAKGNHWTYTVNAGLMSAVRDVKVGGQTPVGSEEGWVLAGPMGESSLAWVDGQLVASRLAGTTYHPPLPICEPGSAEPRSWKGELRQMDTVVPGTATLGMTQEKEDLAGRNLDVWVATLTIKVEGKTIETVTSYANEIGIVRQEERHDGVLIRKLRYVSGP